MNRILYNYRTTVLEVRNAFSFSGLIDLGFEMYRRGIVCIRNVKQYGTDGKTKEGDEELAALAKRCLEEALYVNAEAQTGERQGRRVVVSTGRPSTRDALIKASVAVPCEKHFEALTHCYGKPTGRGTPTIWLHMQNYLNKLESCNYDLATAKDILGSVKVIGDF